MYYVYIRYFSSLAGIPGPARAYLSRLWLVYHSRQGDMHRVLPKLHTKYGKIVRIAPNELAVADLEAIREIYGPGSKYRKSDWYSVWQGTQKTDLFAERSIPVHAALKRNISRAFSMSSLTKLEQGVDGVIALFIARMHEQGPQVVDLGYWLQLLAFDVIGEVAFSRRFGFVDAGKDDGTLGRIELALKSLASVGQMPWVFWVDYYLAPIIGPKLNLALRHGTIRAYASNAVEARRARFSSAACAEDILGQLFKVQEAKPQSLDDDAIASIATATVFAGSDTTAISLRAIIYFLIKNPRCLAHLRKEMEERKRSGLLRFPATFSQVSDWPYLQAVISESLRLHPAVGLNLPRVVPEGGTTISGHFIPAGTTVGVNAWVVHHDPTVFGRDHEDFRPERWLEEDKGNMERYFFAFGGGQRLCIGKNISLMEMSKAIPLFFDTFDVTLVDANKPLHENCQWFVKQEGLLVRLLPRNKP
ncbi:hypothetical protein BDV12DRAFT_206324 [Aspergillus spectabilis]